MRCCSLDAENTHRVVFLLIFYFLVIIILLSIVLSESFLMAVISPSSCFSMLSSCRCVDASTLSSMLANPLPRSFLNSYSLSTSSLRCNALCMVISFLVLWSICLSSSLVLFKKGLEYLTRRYSPSIYSFDSFVSNSFLDILRYSF